MLSLYALWVVFVFCPKDPAMFNRPITTVIYRNYDTAQRMMSRNYNPEFNLYTQSEETI